MKKKSTNTIKIKVDVTKMPNKRHLFAQQTVKAAVFKPKKGKGSWRRNKKIDDQE